MSFKEILSADKQNICLFVVGLNMSTIGVMYALLLNSSPVRTTQWKQKAGIFSIPWENRAGPAAHTSLTMFSPLYSMQ